MVPLVFAAILAPTPPPARAHAPTSPAPHLARAARLPVARGGLSPSTQLFSLRARRRFAAYLRMRLLELREEGLERAADAVERSTSVEELLAPRH